MIKGHRIIIGPGLDGRIGVIALLTRNWKKKYGLTPKIVKITWKDKQSLERKLSKIIDLIDKFSKKGECVSLVGASASGSLMLNAFLKRKRVIHRVVNLGGFLRRGNAGGLRSFERRSASSIAVRESVDFFEKTEPTLLNKDRKKILTVRPLYDELVPGETVVVRGALNKTLPVVEHNLGILSALIFYNPLIRFLKEN